MSPGKLLVDVLMRSIWPPSRPVVSHYNELNSGCERQRVVGGKISGATNFGQARIREHGRQSLTSTMRMNLAEDEKRR